MADEKNNPEAAKAEGAAEVETVKAQNAEAEKVVEERRKQRDEGRDENETRPVFANAVAVGEDDLPSVEDEGVNVLPADRQDPNEGWTAQSELGYVNPEAIPGYYVTKDELPTKEGLAAHDIEPVSYLAGVPVSK